MSGNFGLRSHISGINGPELCFLGNGAAKSVCLHKTPACQARLKDNGLLANDVVSAITPAEYVEMRG